MSTLLLDSNVLAFRPARSMVAAPVAPTRAPAAAAVPATISTRQPRLRLTARGRAVLVTIAAVPLIVLALFLTSGSGSAVATQEAASTPLATVIVLSGQTMWDVAAQVAPQADPREVIADVLAFNGLDSADVGAGQVLDIPAEYRR